MFEVRVIKAGLAKISGPARCVDRLISDENWFLATSMGEDRTVPTLGRSGPSIGTEDGYGLSRFLLSRTRMGQGTPIRSGRAMLMKLLCFFRVPLVIRNDIKSLHDNY